MKLVHRYPVLGSSVDPEKLSLTVKSMGLMLIPVIVAFARMSGVELVENDLVVAVTALSTAISCIGVLIGFGRKIVTWFK